MPLVFLVIFATLIYNSKHRDRQKKIETKKIKKTIHCDFCSCLHHVHKDNAVSQMEQCICATNYRPFDVTDNFQISVLKILYIDCQNILQELKTLM